jgi:hypothetical protein
VTTVAAPRPQAIISSMSKVTELMDVVELQQPELPGETYMMQFGIVLADDSEHSFLPITSYIPSEQRIVQLTLPSRQHTLRMRVMNAAGAWADYDINLPIAVTAAGSTDKEILDAVLRLRIANSTSSQSTTALLMLGGLSWQGLQPTSQDLLLRTQEQLLFKVSEEIVKTAQDRPYHPSFALTVADTLSLISVALKDAAVITDASAQAAKAISAAFQSALSAAGLVPHDFARSAAALTFALLRTETDSMDIAQHERRLAASEDVQFDQASLEIDDLLADELSSAALGIQRVMPINETIALEYTMLTTASSAQRTFSVGLFAVAFVDEGVPGSQGNSGNLSIEPTLESSQAEDFNRVPTEAQKHNSESNQASFRVASPTTAQNLAAGDAPLFVNIKTVPSDLVASPRQMYQPITDALVVSFRTMDTNSTSPHSIRFTLTLPGVRDLPQAGSMAHCVTLVNGRWEELNRLLPGMLPQESYSCAVPGPGTYCVASRDFTFVQGKRFSRVALYTIVPSIVAALLVLGVGWAAYVKWTANRYRRWIRNTEQDLACVSWKVVPVLNAHKLLPLEVAASQSMRTLPKNVLLLDDDL